MYFSSFAFFCLDQWGTMVLPLNMDQSFVYPMNLSLKECMETFGLFDKSNGYLNFNQFIPAKKGCAFIYSTPLTPSLSFGSAISFLIKSAA